MDDRRLCDLVDASPGRQGLRQVAAIDALGAAIDTWEPSLPSKEALAEAHAWVGKWKREHPHFNTAAGQQFL